MLVKICDRCGRRLKQGETCACRNKTYDKFQRDKNKSAFYHSPLWSKVSKLAKERADGLDSFNLLSNLKDVVRLIANTTTNNMRITINEINTCAVISAAIATIRSNKAAFMSR